MLLHNKAIEFDEALPSMEEDDREQPEKSDAQHNSRLEAERFWHRVAQLLMFREF